MIPATPARGENKAGMEGEFGKFEQAVGAIYLDDSSNEQIDYVCAELGRLSVAPGSFKTIEVAARPAG